MNKFQMDYYSKSKANHNGYKMNYKKYEIYIPNDGTYVFCAAEFNQKCNELYETGKIVL